MEQRIIKYYAGELNEEERTSLLRETLSNETLKAEMVECQNLQSLMKLHPYEKDDIAGYRSLVRFKKEREVENRKRLLWKSLRYAAVIVMCVASTWLITFSVLQPDISSMITQQKLTVPAGQRAHIVLPDGSKVWVNASSSLIFSSVFEKERRINLVGEAYFDVAKSDIPFIVSTGKMDVQALGTQFNVFNYPEERLTVSLLKGSVRVYNPANKTNGITLCPNQELIETDGVFKVGLLDKNQLLWKEGLYVFKCQPLRDILKILELYFDVRFTVKNTAILEYEYTGKFRQRDGVMEVLRIIQKIYHFKVKQVENSNEIILYE